ncbi:MAG: sigma-70 family RNA polymerase sigma factor [Cyclobacteriaceae bacterium]|nr:sigma-70 family RNA polymerase sigma factor [Cyclobacteriaceae bacterium HetDA_MAG_MS6]
MEPSIGSKVHSLLLECKEGKSGGQEMLYKHFYGFAMNICYRYVRNEEEAVEILNDSFLKVFKHIDRFDMSRPFEPWLKTILVNNSINYLKKHRRFQHTENDGLDQLNAENMDQDAIGHLSYLELLNMVQQLSPAYRAVFNMYVIDGYKHEEIADKLQISVNTSKTNLLRARENLKKMIVKSSNVNHLAYERRGA